MSRFCNSYCTDSPLQKLSVFFLETSISENMGNLKGGGRILTLQDGFSDKIRIVRFKKLEKVFTEQNVSFLII